MIVALQAVAIAGLAGFALLACSYLLQWIGYRAAAPALRHWQSLPDGFRIAKAQPRGLWLWLAGLVRLQAAGIFVAILATLLLLYFLESEPVGTVLASGLAVEAAAFAIDRAAMAALRRWKRDRLKLA